MSQRLSAEEIQSVAIVHTAPPQTRADRTFGLPTGLYIATVALYLGFIGVMAALFHNPELAIPLVIFGGFVVMAFGLAGYWVKMKPDNGTPALTWGQLHARGIETLSGWLTAREAAIQVLILPVLIMVWGLAIAAIVAFH